MSEMVHRARLVSGGRLQIPADVRRELKLDDGDEMKMTVVDGELRIRPARINWERIHAIARLHVPKGVSMVDELIAERRVEAARE